MRNLCVKCGAAHPDYGQLCDTCRVLLGLRKTYFPKSKALAAVGYVGNREQQEREPEPEYLPRPCHRWPEVNPAAKRATCRQYSDKCQCQTCTMIRRERTRLIAA